MILSHQTLEICFHDVFIRRSVVLRFWVRIGIGGSVVLRLWVRIGIGGSSILILTLKG